MTVYDEIMAERSRQDTQWGGPEHDDQHGALDWAGYRWGFESRLGRAFWKSPFDTDEWRSVTRDSLLKIAALAVAQIESLDRLHSPPTPEGTPK